MLNSFVEQSWMLVDKYDYWRQKDIDRDVKVWLRNVRGKKIWLQLEDCLFSQDITTMMHKDTYDYPVLLRRLRSKEFLSQLLENWNEIVFLTSLEIPSLEKMFTSTWASLPTTYSLITEPNQELDVDILFSNDKAWGTNNTFYNVDSLPLVPLPWMWGQLSRDTWISQAITLVWETTQPIRNEYILFEDIGKEVEWAVIDVFFNHEHWDYKKFGRNVLRSHWILDKSGMLSSLKGSDWTDNLVLWGYKDFDLRSPRLKAYLTDDAKPIEQLSLSDFSPLEYESISQLQELTDRLWSTHFKMPCDRADLRVQVINNRWIILINDWELANTNAPNWSFQACIREVNEFWQVVEVFINKDIENRKFHFKVL